MRRLYAQAGAELRQNEKMKNKKKTVEKQKKKNDRAEKVCVYMHLTTGRRAEKR